MKRRARIGDVIALELKHGFAYLQFAAKHHLGDVCRVFPTIYRSPMEDIQLLERDWEAYRFVTLVSVCLADPRCTWAGKLAVPVDFEAGLAFRSAIDDDDWIVETRMGKTRIGALTDETARIPIAESVPPNYVIRRLEQGWLPEHDRLSWFSLVRAAASPKSNEIIGSAFVAEYGEFADARRAFDTLRTIRLPLNLFCGDGQGPFIVKASTGPINGVAEDELVQALSESGAHRITRLHPVASSNWNEG